MDSFCGHVISNQKLKTQKIRDFLAPFVSISTEKLEDFCQRELVLKHGPTFHFSRTEKVS